MKAGQSRKRLAFGIGAVLIAAGGAAAVLVVGSEKQQPRISSHGEPITEIRTVMVAMTNDGRISSSRERLHGVHMDGVKPSGSMMATVESDENCAPDAQGVSHCTNRLRMDSGAMMVIRHPHRMSEVPCLSPGERIRVEAA